MSVSDPSRASSQVWIIGKRAAWSAPAQRESGTGNLVFTRADVSPGVKEKRMSTIQTPVTTWSKRQKVVSLATTAALIASGCTAGQVQFVQCSPAGQPAASSFWGSVAQTAAMIALDVTRCAEGDRVRVFLTDGKLDGDSEYFEGAMTNGKFVLASRSGKAAVDGQVAD